MRQLFLPVAKAKGLRVVDFGEIECGRPIDKVLIRTAESYEDFGGGSNNYARLNVQDIAELAIALTT